MASLLRHRDCPVCGGTHNFCLPFGEIGTGQTFAFRCPEQDRLGELLAPERGEPSRFYLPGAVTLEGSDRDIGYGSHAPTS